MIAFTSHFTEAVPGKGTFLFALDMKKFFVDPSVNNILDARTVGREIQINSVPYKVISWTLEDGVFLVECLPLEDSNGKKET